MTDQSMIVATLDTELRRVHHLAFAPNDRHLLVAGGVPGESGDLELWDWRSARCVTKAAVHDDVIYDADWSADGQSLATASWDSRCHVLRSNDFSMITTYSGHSQPVLAVSFVGNSKFVVSAGVDHTIQMWTSDTGQLTRKFDNHVGAVYDVAMRPAASNDALTWMATASEDRSVRFWQPTVGRMVRFARLESVPLCLDWNKDGSRVLAGCQDGSVREIDPVTLEVKLVERRSNGPVNSLP
jgi:WD40 repeat protein